MPRRNRKRALAVVETEGEGSSVSRTSPSPDPASQIVLLRYLKPALIAVALLYAFLAGFHTIQDYDLGWQLASGRWMAQHHQIPSADVLSYTAQGTPWTYPVLPAFVFYFLVLAGGYSALTWLTATASLLTTLLLIRQRTKATVALAIVAVPVIALRLTPRAELFGTIFFAAVLGIVWRYYRSGKSELWLLPPVMFLWVNSHWGFLTGIGLCGAYILLETAELPFATRRQAALHRLQKAWPWLLAALAATLLNPWGPAFYGEVVNWGKSFAVSQSSINWEFTPLRTTGAAMLGALDWRNPDLSGIWWLLHAALVAGIIAVWKKNIGAAIVLAGSGFAALHRYRSQGMFACIVVVVAGSLLSDAWAAWRTKVPPRSGPLRGSAAPLVVCACIVLFTALRSYDLVSNRYYNNFQPFHFGAGLSWWYPERAASFVERERLPANLYNGYEAGGYLAWRLPQYPVFIDGRGRPFVGDVESADAQLPGEAPDSAAWRNAADKWNFNFMIIPVGRISGYEYFPRLKDWCEAQSWRPVYLDEVAAVFARRNAQTQNLIDHSQVDCKSARFVAPAGASREERFEFYVNEAYLFAILERPQESLEALNSAQELFPDSATVQMQRGSVLMALGRLQEGEAALRRSVELQPDEANLDSLSDVLWAELQYDEAIHVLQRACDLSQQPIPLYLKLGQWQAQMQHGQKALASFDEAERFLSRLDAATFGIADVKARIAEERARVWFAMGDSQRAVTFEEQAVKLTPGDVSRWKNAAALYQAVGRTKDAEEATQRAQRIAASLPSSQSVH